MLTLYYSPGACSLASHIAIEETGAPFEAVETNTGRGEQRRPEYLAVNPKGRVPALAVDGRVLTENPAILQYLARRFPEAGLWPDDPWDQARCAEWLAWIASTIHPAYAHIRRPERYAESEAAKADVTEKGRANVRQHWAEVERKLAAEAAPFAVGDRVSVADCYLVVFWVWGGNPTVGLDMAGAFPTWTALVRTMAKRPAVQRAFAREGLPLPG